MQIEQLGPGILTISSTGTIFFYLYRSVDVNYKSPLWFQLVIPTVREIYTLCVSMSNDELILKE